MESPKEKKAETKGKEKAKGRKDNVSTKSQNHQKNSGQLDLGEQWSDQSWTAEADTASWRDDDWNAADSNSQTAAAAEEFQRASVGDFRLSNLGFAKHTKSSQPDRLDPSQRTITFGIGTAAMQNCCSCQSPCSTWIFDPQRLPTWMRVQHCRGDKVYDQGKRIVFTLDGTGKPIAIESRKVNC